MRALSGVLGRRDAGADVPRRSRGSPVATTRNRRWVAWCAVLVVAASPYAIRYSTEARMYMLAMVLVLVGYLAVRRDRSTTVRRVPASAAVALSPRALLYTQYWAFFLVGVVGALMVFRAWRAPRPERRDGVRGGARRSASGGLLFLPWLPTFLSQLPTRGRRGTRRSSPPTNAALGIVDFAGGKMRRGLVARPAAGAAGACSRSSLARPVRGRSPSTCARCRASGGSGSWAPRHSPLGLTLSYVGGTGFQSRYAAVMYPLFALAVAHRACSSSPTSGSAIGCSGLRRRGRVRRRRAQRDHQPDPGVAGRRHHHGRGPARATSSVTAPTSSGRTRRA